MSVTIHEEYRGTDKPLFAFNIAKELIDELEEVVDNGYVKTYELTNFDIGDLISKGIHKWIQGNMTDIFMHVDDNMLDFIGKNNSSTYRNERLEEAIPEFVGALVDKGVLKVTDFGHLEDRPVCRTRLSIMAFKHQPE